MTKSTFKGLKIPKSPLPTGEELKNDDHGKLKVLALKKKQNKTFKEGVSESKEKKIKVIHSLDTLKTDQINRSSF